MGKRPPETLRLEKALRRYRRGDATLRETVEALRHLPFEDLGFARVDHHRPLRTGYPEVVYAAGKTPEQVAEIAARIHAHGGRALVTRAGADVWEAVRGRVRGARRHEAAGAITVGRRPGGRRRGLVLVLAAGTSDLPVAEEAAVTAEFLGPNRVERAYDVGVAGVHRLLAEAERLGRARVVIAVAGMEGALPSLVGGLVGVPVIGVPTSVGYGTSFGGLSALLSILNACSPGVAAVNIDNGFGAGYLASLINLGKR
jgi:NCAIR mutase (PurE)-related protein